MKKPIKKDLKKMEKQLKLLRLKYIEARAKKDESLMRMIEKQGKELKDDIGIQKRIERANQLVLEKRNEKKQQSEKVANARKMSNPEWRDQ